MIKDILENFFEVFVTPNNNDEIIYEDYGYKGLRLFKKADQVGRGFSVRSDVAILRSIAI